ncbi:hypothetical protein ACSNOI_32485 [Actinomadura kijaniata]|uniref:hypothetical protein n=1 Tax=Actinomadura kijaniata TaxID=46161 RepID=UPI003F1A51A0
MSESQDRVLVPEAWVALPWPWDLTDPYLRLDYLDEFAGTDEEIAVALRALTAALEAVTDPEDRRWLQPPGTSWDARLPAGMVAAWTPILNRLIREMPRFHQNRRELEAGRRWTALFCAPAWVWT